MNKSNRLAIIPARANSKRLPGKNRLNLGGKPLISYTIEAAVNSKLFDRIIVTSDDPEIRPLAESYGVDFHDRPGEFAGDQVTLSTFLKEYLADNSFAAVDQVALLLPTCPLRDASHIKQAFSIIQKDEFLISVCEYDFPPQFAFRLENENSLKALDQEILLKTTQKQAVETLYHPNGAIYIFPRTVFLKEGTFFSQPLKPFFMEKKDSVDIDYLHQFEQAALLLLKKHETENS